MSDFSLFGKHPLLAALAATVLATNAWAQSPVHTERRPASNEAFQPESVADLQSLQDRVKDVVARCRASTVGIFVGNSAGSGVVVKREDGYYVLTAGHVSGGADRDCQLVLPNGKRLKGRTLGANNGIDSGLIKIVDKGEFDHAETGKSKPLKPASGLCRLAIRADIRLVVLQWCVLAGSLRLKMARFKPTAPWWVAIRVALCSTSMAKSSASIAASA